MRKLNLGYLGIILALLLSIIGCNLYLRTILQNDGSREYRVQINRLQNEIITKGLDGIDLSNYPSVKQVTVLDQDTDAIAFFEGSSDDYLLKNINGTYYRFDYIVQQDHWYGKIVLAMNIVLSLMSLFVLGVLLYTRFKFIRPFHTIKEMPYELSKGNLTVGLKENKNRIFGRFIWGLDLLREKLEEQRLKELMLQKEKKTLILSISHDIKTPLSAIKLYAKALARNLYDSEEKRIEIAENISHKADEIEGFVSEIIKASNEDFLRLEVQNGEFYLNELMDKIEGYYKEKLALYATEFDIVKYRNCLIKGDLNRAVEVVQNIIENAIKYGDGKTIKISITSEEDCRLIAVSNSGNSLPENEIPHIFESFWRGSNTGKNSGSGLGLYICRQLMKKMNGDIFAQINGEEMCVTAVFRIA